GRMAFAPRAHRDEPDAEQVKHWEASSDIKMADRKISLPTPPIFLSAIFMSLEVDQLVISQSDLHLIVDPIYQFVAVAREEVKNVDLALLQILIRIERGEESFDLLSGAFVALAAVVNEARAQVVELIENLFAPAFQGVGQGRINRAERRVQLLQLVIKDSLGLVEDRRGVLVEAALDNRLHDLFESGEQVGEFDVVLAHRLGVTFFDEREAPSREHQRINAVEQAVIRAQLREVGDFGGAADVGDG